MECDYSSEEDEPTPASRSKEKGDGSSRNEPEIVEVEPGISIHALSGSPNPRTMRLIGRVLGCVVVILIDMGSTHNFMDPSIAKKIQLMVQPIDGLTLKIANRAALNSEGKCLEVHFHMQGNSYFTEFFLLTLGVCDIGLGIQ